MEGRSSGRRAFTVTRSTRQPSRFLQIELHAEIVLGDGRAIEGRQLIDISPLLAVSRAVEPTGQTEAGLQIQDSPAILHLTCGVQLKMPWNSDRFETAPVSKGLTRQPVSPDRRGRFLACQVMEEISIVKGLRMLWASHETSG